MKNNYIILLLMLSTLFACNSTPETSKKETLVFSKEYLESTLNFSDSLKNEIQNLISKSDSAKANALTFLYSYMSLVDKVDYPTSYYSNFVDISLEIKSEMQWSSKIPEEIFYHFVLPHRSNNEELDTSRIFFYHQLKARVENLSMMDAALEVNHWCHEHVSYQSSDGRTSAPIATYFKGYGRCGEESVFTVAALRSVGIPARQVYTPRWAHTDDNHAWVEFWADGKWYYYGACEPTAVANTGWFTEPARRSMLVSARVFGPYNGNENILDKTSYNSATNSLSVYAKTNDLNIQIKDVNGNTLKGAMVEFQLYNYGEFYSIHKSKTDKYGIASFETGIGDLLIWAHTDSTYAYTMYRNNSSDTLQMVLKDISSEEFSINLQYHPPIKPEPIVKDLSKDSLNKIQLVYEDSLRKAYEGTFMDSITCVTYADRNNVDINNLWPIIKKSRANSLEITRFLDNSPENLKSRAMDLLHAISLKDLQDTKAETLLHHLINTIPYEELKDIPEDIYIKYILNARIGGEFIWRWRVELNSPNGTQNSAIEYFNWAKENLIINDTLNYSRVPINPASVIKYKISDAYSRDIAMVAIWRANGIAGRLESGTNFPQYYQDREWHTVIFKQIKDKAISSFGFLKLEAQDPDQKLLYYKHFTIAKLNDGIYKTLEYEWDKNINTFPEEIKLEIGSYRLCTGNRLADGSVLVNFTFFEITENQTKTIEVSIIESKKEIEVFGVFNAVTDFKQASQKQSCTIINKSYKILVWFHPNHEPSKHIIEDISKVKSELSKTNTDLLLINNEAFDYTKLDNRYFGNLPQNTQFLVDENNSLFTKLSLEIRKKMDGDYPWVFVLRPNNEVIYYSNGYTIGIGDDIIKLIKGDL